MKPYRPLLNNFDARAGNAIADARQSKLKTQLPSLTEDAEKKGVDLSEYLAKEQEIQESYRHPEKIINHLPDFAPQLRAGLAEIRQPIVFHESPSVSQPLGGSNINVQTEQENPVPDELLGLFEDLARTKTGVTADALAKRFETDRKLYELALNFVSDKTGPFSLFWTLKNTPKKPSSETLAALTLICSSEMPLNRTSKVSTDVDFVDEAVRARLVDELKKPWPDLEEVGKLEDQYSITKNYAEFSDTLIMWRAQRDLAARQGTELALRELLEKQPSTLDDLKAFQESLLALNTRMKTLDLNPYQLSSREKLLDKLSAIGLNELIDELPNLGRVP